MIGSGPAAEVWPGEASGGTASPASVERLRQLLHGIDARYRQTPREAARAFRAATADDEAAGAAAQAAIDAARDQDGATGEAGGTSASREKRADGDGAATGTTPDEPESAGVRRLERALVDVARQLQRGQRGCYADHVAGSRRTHALLYGVAHGAAAVAQAIDRRLAWLSRQEGDFIKLGLGATCLADYAREVLHRARRTTQADLELARGLETRPLLRQAVLAGLVDRRNARMVLAAAQGEREAAWVELARVTPVRELVELVRQCGFKLPDKAPDEDELQARIVSMTPEQRERFDLAHEVARVVLGTQATYGRDLEAWCQEFLGSFGEWLDDDGGPKAPAPAEKGAVPPAVALAARAEAFLARISAAAPASGTDAATSESASAPAAESPPLRPPPDPEVLALLPAEVRGAWAPLDGLTVHQVHAQIKELAVLERRWDLYFAKLAWLTLHRRTYAPLGARGVADYCERMLGLPPETLRRYARLQIAVTQFPQLAQAMAEGRIGYVKALHVARYTSIRATAEEIEAAIAEAAATSVAELQRRHRKKRDREMGAQGQKEVRTSKDVLELVDACGRIFRVLLGRPVGDGEVLALLADHFVATWGWALKGVDKKRKAVLDRTEGCCAVPGCTRTAQQVHHIRFRSHQGGDEPENLLGLCAAHHLHCLHLGWLKITGRVGDEVVFEMGLAGAGQPGYDPQTWVQRGDEAPRRVTVEETGEAETPYGPSAPDGGPATVREARSPAYGRGVVGAPSPAARHPGPDAPERARPRRERPYPVPGTRRRAA